MLSCKNIQIPGLLTPVKYTDLNIGPFFVRVSSTISEFHEKLWIFYAHYPACSTDFLDFHISIDATSGLRKWLKQQIVFSLDGKHPFKPLPKAQAFPAFEWGLNWCISSHCHTYLVIHAAVIEKNGHAIIMPAQPGSGKSTLTAGLVSRGWRLLSDELTLIPVDQPGGVVPIPRPINLKNESIEIMKSYAPHETFGSVVRDTVKGTVAHMRAPKNSVERMDELARATHIIYPLYLKDSETVLNPRSKARSFMEIAQQSFNFHILGKTGFDLLNQLMTACDCYNFTYSNLDEAVALFDSLVEAPVPEAILVE